MGCRFGWGDLIRVTQIFGREYFAAPCRRRGLGFVRSFWVSILGSLILAGFRIRVEMRGGILRGVRGGIAL